MDRLEPRVVPTVARGDVSHAGMIGEQCTVTVVDPDVRRERLMGRIAKPPGSRSRDTSTV